MATWPSLFKKWAKRFGGETNWRCKVEADLELDRGDLAAVTFNQEYRTATFRYRPGSEPENATACHEAVHLLVARLYIVAQKLAATSGEPAKQWVEAANEEVVEEIANLFLVAYGEE